MPAGLCGRLAALAAACALFLSAQAAQAASSAGWTVGPVAAGGGRHCSMKSVYDDGQALVFARDDRHADSVAIDFGAPVFESGRQYLALLEVPPLARRMTAVAATPRVLLINMAGDPEFYDMLARKNLLRVTAAKRATAYVLTGSTEALKNLGACVRAVSGGAAYAPRNVAAALTAVPATPAATARSALVFLPPSPAVISVTRPGDSAGKVLEREKQTLEEEVALLRAEKARLESSLAAAVKEGPAEGMDDGLKNLLSAAGLAADVSGGGYAWRSGDIYGTAEKTPVRGVAGFSGMVAEYIDRMADRCAGDFAHRSAPVESARGMTVQKAELACIGNGAAAAAALLFIGEEDTFTAVMHEGPAARVEGAIAGRDAIAAAIPGFQG